MRLTQILTCGHFFFVSVSPTLSHSGCSGLEVCGAGAGQDFPVGLPHSVNTGDCPYLHSCSADVPQHTLINTDKLNSFNADLFITLNKINKSNQMYISTCIWLLLNQTFTFLRYALQPVMLSMQLVIQFSCKLHAQECNRVEAISRV